MFNPGDPDLPGELVDEEALASALIEDGPATPIREGQLLLIGLIPTDAYCPVCKGRINDNWHEITGEQVVCLLEYRGKGHTL